MIVNLIKLCVGAESIANLASWQKQRRRGSLYWVISGFISVRQKIIELRPLDRDGISYCGLLLDKKLIRTEPRLRKAFQCWRYFEATDTPPDLVMQDVNMPDKMLHELAELGLI